MSLPFLKGVPALKLESYPHDLISPQFRPKGTNSKYRNIRILEEHDSVQSS